MTAKKPDRCCRNCALWDISAAKSVSGRVLSHSFAQCKWKSTEVWPYSARWSVRPIPRYCTADMGKDCACFTPREK
jgi:hypothetical protein